MSVPSDYIPTIEQFFNDLHGTGLYGVLGQYSGIHNTVTEVGALLNTSSYPKDCSFNTNCLNNATVQNMVSAAIDTSGWSTGANDTYLVFTAPHETVCRTGGVGDCYPSGGCAFHDYFSTGALGTGSKVVYGVVPYQSSDIAHCHLSFGPHNLDTDTAVSFASHEDFEMVTDPLGAGWFTGTQYLPGQQEIGDLCATEMGQQPAIYDRGVANQKMRGHYYIVQSEWSNSAGSCVRNDRHEHILDVEPASLSAGSPVYVAGESFTPGEQVRVEFHTGLPSQKVIQLCSPPQAGSITVRSDGSFVCVDYLPAELAAVSSGLHRISATGMSSNLTIRSDVNITPATVVRFVGDPANPQIAISGSGFGAQPPATNLASVGYTGIDYGNALFFCDTSNNPQRFCAGQNDGLGNGGDTIGLVITTYTDSQISYMFGSAYSRYYSPTNIFKMQQGDGFTLHINGKTCSGVVTFSAPVSCLS